jgi:hypothetical protein
MTSRPSNAAQASCVKSTTAKEDLCGETPPPHPSVGRGEQKSAAAQETQMIPSPKFSSSPRRRTAKRVASPLVARASRACGPVDGVR